MSHRALKSVQSFLLLATTRKKTEESIYSLQKVTKALYFTYSWRSPMWTDFSQLLHIRRYANICANFGMEKWRVWDIEGGGQSEFGLCHWSGWLGLQSCCATGQPWVILQYYNITILQRVLQCSRYPPSARTHAWRVVHTTDQWTP